jgi:hypothetical protein
LKQYDFSEGSPDALFNYAFTPSLFNLGEHLLLQDKHRWHSFFVCERTTQTIHALVHFHISEGEAISPFRAPYGGVEYSDELPHETLFTFITFVDKRLKSLRVRKIIIKSSPEIYQANASPLATLLVNQGYIISSSELSAALTVASEPIFDRLHRSEKRKLIKAEHEGLMFVKMHDLQLQIVYKFIKECRQKKGFGISMSLEQVTETFQVFKNRFHFFGVYHGDNQLVAASIAIQVKDDVLYDFYHDHDAAYDHLSPVVLLVAGIYDFCRYNKYKLLDLGTSSLENTPNFPLLHFKLLLGATISNKFTFQKDLV